MNEQTTCPVCGLPNELCVCSDVEKTSSLIEIKVEKRKYGKLWAIISGIDVSHSDLKELVKSVEILYGSQDRTNEMIKILVELGFNRDSIHVTSLKK